MPCTARYAEAWQFAGFWCTAALLSRFDDSGGAGNAFLTDSQADFVNSGVQANVGMVLYNVTDGSSGPVTTVTGTTITATLAGGTDNLWDDGDVYRIVTIDSQEIATIELYLDVAAADIFAALGATNACDCTLASWADSFLQKLNIIDAAAYYQCPCGQPKMTDDMRQSYLEWASEQLNLIRTTEIEVCDGHTASTYPAWGIAQYSFTERNWARIIVNDILRDMG